MTDKDYTNFAVGVVLIFIAAVIWVGSSISDFNTWNGGYCSCGGHWVYQQAVGHRYSTHYIYKCDTCGEIHEFMEKRDYGVN